MKKKIQRMLKQKEEARQALLAKTETTDDVAELRSIQTQLVALNGEITELRGMLDDGEGSETSEEDDLDDDVAARTAAVTSVPVSPEKRRYTPGKGFSQVEGGDGADERTAKDFKDREKRGKDLKEGRAVTVSSSNVVLAKHAASTINPTFNKVSGLVDLVDIMVLPGGESFAQPYEKDTPEGGYTAEGIAATTADTEFGTANIIKSKVTAYSEITNEVKKLPAADYEGVVMNGISKSCRRKLAKEILIGDGAANHLAGIFSTAADAIDAATDLPIDGIDNTTLDEIIFSYGGSEEVEDQAMLILNKLDLKAFSQLRNTDGSKFHTIVSKGNAGTIDGIPYIINSACKPVSASTTAADQYCMAYGPLSNYKLVIFSELDVQRSTDYKFKEGMIAHRGEVYAGGNVVAHNGFLRVKKAE